MIDFAEFLSQTIQLWEKMWECPLLTKKYCMLEYYPGDLWSQSYRIHTPEHYMVKSPKDGSWGQFSGFRIWRCPWRFPNVWSFPSQCTLFSSAKSIKSTISNCFIANSTRDIMWYRCASQGTQLQAMFQILCHDVILKHFCAAFAMHPFRAVNCGINHFRKALVILRGTYTWMISEQKCFTRTILFFPLRCFRTKHFIPCRSALWFWGPFCACEVDRRLQMWSVVQNPSRNFLSRNIFEVGVYGERVEELFFSWRCIPTQATVAELLHCCVFQLGVWALFAVISCDFTTWILFLRAWICYKAHILFSTFFFETRLKSMFRKIGVPQNISSTNKFIFLGLWGSINSAKIQIISSAVGSGVDSTSKMLGFHGSLGSPAATHPGLSRNLETPWMSVAMGKPWW